MTVLNQINIKSIKEIANDMLDTVEYLEKYGYATSSKKDDEKVKNHFKDFLEYSKKAQKALNEIENIAEDNFSY